MDSSLIEIPNFEGFSYSWIDSEMDHVVSYELEYYLEEYELNEEEKEEVENSFFSQNMEELKEEISKAYVSAYFQPIEEETSISLSPIFESLGRQYHPCHALDILYCELPENEVIELLRWIFKNKYEELKEVIKQRFTACDGYYPHYENDLKKWGKISLWDHNQIGTALLVFFMDDEFNYQLHEDVSTVINENIFNTLSDDTQEFLNKRWQKIDAKKAQLSLSF
tara:strand:+ start:124 stop:795 length:672 start_codon:yes stop_codon:yes gene_type:complete